MEWCVSSPSPCAGFAGFAVGRSLTRTTVPEETIDRVVNAFVDEKFPTVIALNKIDHPDADKNIAKIAKMQDPNKIVLCSAISEIFLRKLAKQGYIRYIEGSDIVDTREDLIADGDPDGGGLKELDAKNKNRIENLKDMVLYRFGSTGVVQVLSKAAELLGLVPVFPVRNTTTFGSGAGESKYVFRDCVLARKNSTVADVIAAEFIGTTQVECKVVGKFHRTDRMEAVGFVNAIVPHPGHYPAETRCGIGIEDELFKFRLIE